MDQRVKLIRSCEWEEVFLSWFQGEGDSQKWLNIVKEKGFASWADWRLKCYAKRFECAKATWGLYEVSEPCAVVSTWFGGPFQGWIKNRYQGKKTSNFLELADQEEVKNHRDVQAIIKNYPETKMIIALETKDGKIFVIEGMHRSCALGIMEKNGLSCPKKLVFAIGKSDFSELPVFESMA
ncbi:MAG: hypothetical protein ACOYMB_00880 [Patescibacteria group bacterium]